MRIPLLALAPALGLAALAVPCLAQLAGPNDAGVSMGHLHLTVRGLADHRPLWVDGLGAVPVKFGTMEAYKFPDVLVFLRQGNPSGGSDGSTVNHLGFKVKDIQKALDKFTAAGGKLIREMPATRQAFIQFPDDVKVELSEDAGMSAPIAHHHVHFYSATVEDTRDWYVKTFSAKSGRRGRFEAADLPGVNLSFSPAESQPAPTKGRSVDHIGFEVRDLEGFCKKLEAAGVKFDIPYRKVPALGIAVAFFTDPWGTYIELTEGLGRL